MDLEPLIWAEDNCVTCWRLLEFFVWITYCVLEWQTLVKVVVTKVGKFIASDFLSLFFFVLWCGLPRLG